MTDIETRQEALVADARFLPRRPWIPPAEPITRRRNPAEWSPFVWVPLCAMPGVAVAGLLILVLYVLGIR